MPAQQEQVELPPPPQIAPEEPELNQQRAPAPPQQLPPAPRRTIRRRETQQPAQAPPVAQQPAAHPPEAQAAPAPEVPQLEQILTPEQRQAYTEAIDANIGKAQRTLETLRGRKLTRDQRLSVQRIRAFLDQAQEARKNDLFRANTLAERANVLADDLLRSLQ